MGKTSIEWTRGEDGMEGKTWNPVRGCTKVSPGCKNCYAETFAERFRGVPGHPYEQGFDLRLVPDKLDEPLHWRKPCRVFVNSMSDLFHEDVPDEFIDRVFAVMALAPQHSFQVLTKRPERMREYFVRLEDRVQEWDQGEGETEEYLITKILESDCDEAIEKACRQWLYFWNARHLGWPLPNVWLGVSVENRQHGLPRIDVLRQVPAALRFLSIEPLLEDIGQLDLTGISWLILGGESGAKARPFNLAWARSLRDQCQNASVPFFFKQAGGNVLWNGIQGGYGDGPSDCWPQGTKREDSGRGSWRVFLRDKKGGDLLELPEDVRIREFPKENRP